MSQQINLYDPALLRKREWLTATNLAALAAGLVLLLGAWGGVARSRFGSLEGESQILSPQIKALQEQKDAINAQLTAMKPDQQIERELAEARTKLDLHTRQVSELKKGIGTETDGFAEYLRGFARQTPTGLWLTGFAIGDGGTSMEIRGRMTDPSLLADYIRRLDSEHAFRGREFSALKVAAGKLEPSGDAPAAPASPTPGQTAAPAPAPALAPAPSTAGGPAPFYEFSLAPRLVRAADAAGTPR